MISLSDAQARVFEDVRPNPVVEVDVCDAVGLVPAQEVASAIQMPPFISVAMDGFAIVAADSTAASATEPVELPVVETIPAGTTASRELRRGEAMRIMTGAPLPEGADAVIKVELTEAHFDAEAGTESVSLHAAIDIGNHLRPAGSDVEPGDIVVTAGTVLDASHIGLLISTGLATIKVYQRPRVGVISTGDELLAPPTPLGPGQIYDSNRPMLLAQVEAAGCTPVDLGHVADDEALVEAAFVAGAADCDAIVSSGGVSMGDYDPVKEVLSRLGDHDWMQIAIKPAKPLSFGLVNDTPIFGLPGNPVSASVSFELFARPSLRMMLGDSKPFRRLVTAIADEPMRRRLDGKTHFVRVVASNQSDGALHVRYAGGQGSHQLRALAASNALAVLPDGAQAAAGGRVKVLLTDDSVFSSSVLNE